MHSFQTRTGVPPASGRMLQIDLLRAVAVLLVICRHLTSSWSQPASGPVWQVFNFLHGGGWVGVDLFFVLSGFLVSGLLFQEFIRAGMVDVWRFLVRRGFKIYPAFWLFIAVTIALSITVGKPIPLPGILRELAFLQNYGGGLWGHTWSLAVEEHFYIGLALLVFFVTRFGTHSKNPFGVVPALTCGILVAVLLLRFWISFRYPWAFGSHVFRTHLRFDSLMFGVLISWLFWFRNEELTVFARRARWWLLGCGLVLLAPAFVVPIENSRWISSIGFTAFYVGSGLILLFALYSPAPRARMMRMLAGIGYYSYSIYLWHMLVVNWIVPNLGKGLHFWSFSWHALCCLAGSIVLGVVAARLVEMPVLRLRDKFFPSLTGGRLVDPPAVAVAGLAVRTTGKVELTR